MRLNVPCHRCVVVDDSPVGIEAAKAAGAKSIGLLTTTDPAGFDACGAADAYVNKLEDIGMDLIDHVAAGNTGNLRKNG
jgi:beta-phosphoglucomutase-like phosphatase (HAD superfamily)